MQVNMSTLADSQMANASESSSSEAASQEQEAGVAATSNGQGLLQAPQQAAASQNAMPQHGEGAGAYQGGISGDAAAARLQGTVNGSSLHYKPSAAAAGASPTPVHAGSRAVQARHLRHHLVSSMDKHCTDHIGACLSSCAVYATPSKPSWQHNIHA
jgi:hypothetical protein